MIKTVAVHPKRIAQVLLAFLAIALMLFVERSGIHYRLSKRLPYLQDEQWMTAQQALEGREAECLLLVDSSIPTSTEMQSHMQQILLDMKIPTQVHDLHEAPLPPLDSYRRLIYTSPWLDPLGADLKRVHDWVQDGGNALFAQPLGKNQYLDVIARWLGISGSGHTYETVSSMEMADGFLLGGERTVRFQDTYDAALQVALDEDATVYAWEAEEKTPLIWTRDQGDGRYVVCNFGYCEKATRGFYAAAISLMDDYTAYPVINAASWYLDDFPAPIPQGSNEYIDRDYHCTTAYFLRNIWWQDLMRLASDYGIRYTGVVIESYDDRTDAVDARPADTSSFQYYGDMVLHINGEIGFHGYNHQPLVLDGTLDYEGRMPYHTWPTKALMREAIHALRTFTRELFPNGEQSVYVPPSNILGQEGRQVLVEDDTIRCIASLLHTGDFAYAQEFSVAEDGMVEAPRVISGLLLDDFMYMSALSELNLHYVSSHFTHPDDVLDVDRGATLGWEELHRRLKAYMDWLYTAAPEIRNLTASEQAGAIQRFAALSHIGEKTENGIRISVQNLFDEAYMLIRINEGIPRGVSGGKLEHLTGNLYLLQVQQPQIEIELG